MDHKLKLSSIAQKEFTDSFEWYEERSPGRGNDFAQFIYDGIDSILLNPEAYPIKNAEAREFVVDKYPFVIVYEFRAKSNLIIIVHIFHTSRNPKRKNKRR
jgi:toxin ParE1/3/4